MTSFDQIDHRIIRLLQENARISNQELADAVGLSPSPCLRRVRRLEEAGVFARYAALVDQSVLGLPITAFVRITLDSHTVEAVDAAEDHIRTVPEIVEAYVLAGDEDYLLKIVAESFEAFEEITRTCIRDVPGLASVRTSFAFGVTKQLSPVPSSPDGRRRVHAPL